MREINQDSAKKTFFKENGKLLFFIGTAICMINLTDYFETKEKEAILFEEEFRKHHAFTYLGRSVLSSEYESSLFLSGELFLVQYRGQYFLVNSELQMLGTENFFQIVKEEEQRGLKFQILENDIIPFSTVLMNGKAKVTLFEAYDMIDERNINYPLFPEFKEVSYPINDAPCQAGISFYEKMSSSEICFYLIQNLYVVNSGGNLYLCREETPGVFSVLYDSKRYMDKTFCFSFDAASSNSISKCQVKKFSKLLQDGGFIYSENSSVSLAQGYQLLDTLCKISPDLNFSENYISYAGYTKAQVQYANQFLTLGERYLDEYHMDTYASCSSYDLNDVLVVCLGNSNYVLASSVIYDEVSENYHIVPLQISTMYLLPLKGSGYIKVIPFQALFDIPNIHGMSADYYYTVFRDFLVKYGPDALVPYEISSEVCSYILPVVKDLGKKLNLNLTYMKE